MNRNTHNRNLKYSFQKNVKRKKKTKNKFLQKCNEQYLAFVSAKEHNSFAQENEGEDFFFFEGKKYVEHVMNLNSEQVARFIDFQKSHTIPRERKEKKIFTLK